MPEKFPISGSNEKASDEKGKVAEGNFEKRHSLQPQHGRRWHFFRF